MRAGKNMPEDNFVKPRKLKRSLVESMKNLKVAEPREKKKNKKKKTAKSPSACIDITCAYGQRSSVS